MKRAGKRGLQSRVAYINFLTTFRAAYIQVRLTIKHCLQSSKYGKSCWPTVLGAILARAPTWRSAAPGRVEKCLPPPPLPPLGSGKDHLLFLLFTKSAAPSKSSAPGVFPPLSGPWFWQNNFSASTCFANFELIKFMFFGSAFSYPHKDFLIQRSTRTRSKYNLLAPCSKFNPHPHAYLRGFPHPPCQCEYPKPARVNSLRAGL